MDEVDKFLQNENEFIIEKLNPNVEGEQNKEFYGSLYLTNWRLINFRKTKNSNSFQDFPLEHITSVKFEHITSAKYDYRSFNLLLREPSFLLKIFFIIFGTLLYFLIGFSEIGNDNSDSFGVSVSFFLSICSIVFIFIGSVAIIDTLLKIHIKANNGFLVIFCDNKIVLNYPISDNDMLNRVPKFISQIHWVDHQQPTHPIYEPNIENSKIKYSKADKDTNLSTEPTMVEPEPEPTMAEPEPEPTMAEPEPEPTMAEPEPEPTMAEPEPEPTMAEPEPEPTMPEPEPELIMPELEPELIMPEPEPELIMPEPEPELIMPEPEPELIMPELEPELIMPEPEPELIMPEPEPELIMPKPEPELIQPLFKTNELNIPEDEFDFDDVSPPSTLTTANFNASLKDENLEFDFNFDEFGNDDMFKLKEENNDVDFMDLSKKGNTSVDANNNRNNKNIDKKICQVCGAELESKCKFCTECGASLKN